MQIVIYIPDEDVPNKQAIMEIVLHFINGEVCECTYPYIVLPKGHDRLIDVDIAFHHLLEKDDRMSISIIIKEVKEDDTESD